MSGRLRAEAGFTLIELLIAMVLVAGGVMLVLREVTTGEQATARAAAVQAASATADATLERLRALPYDDVALAPPAQAVPPAIGEDPLARVSGPATGTRRLQVPGGPLEELVAEDPASPVPAFERTTAPLGGGTVQLRVYRFVSWRDEECPLLRPDGLDAALGDVAAALAAVDGRLTRLDGRVSDAVERTGALEALPLVGPLVQDLRTRALDPLRELLALQAGPVGRARTALERVVDPVTGRVSELVDLCDLPSGAVPDLDDLRAAQEALDAAAAALAVTEPAVEEVAGLLGGGSPPDPVTLTRATADLLGEVGALAVVLDAARDARGAQQGLPALAGELRASLTVLRTALTDPGTDRNSKRVTVAVVVEGPLAPRRPVWSSTVVTDPEEGLL